MLKKNRIAIATTSLLMVGAGAAWADDAAPAKPTGPSLSDVLGVSGITASGYVSATYAYTHADATISSAKVDTSNFQLQEAALTISMLPTSGFGALVNLAAGVNEYKPVGYSVNTVGTSVNLVQAYAQYAGGPWTLQAGKLLTLAGAEVFASPGNTNVTRSLLYAFEPVTHTGVRATYAASDKLSLIVGVNDGWINSSEVSDTGKDQTAELGLSFTPNKMLAWTLQGYYGRDNNPTYGTKANIGLLDTVLTWTATSAVTVVGSVDYGSVGSTPGSPSASWYGVAGYFNYAINDLWRVSVRGEYYDDRDGYLTLGAPVPSAEEKFWEGTVTFGYDPSKNFELRLEGRYDEPNKVLDNQVLPKSYQGWIEALYKFPGM